MTDNSVFKKKEEKTKPIHEDRQSEYEATEARRSVLRLTDLIPLLYVLKTTTDYDHAMSIPRIADQMNLLIPNSASEQDYYAERTIRRKLELFTDTKSDAAKRLINLLMPELLGGTIESRMADGIEKGTNQNGSGSQKRYYFEPVLSKSDLNLINGALMSSRYLSEDEKNYLLSRLNILQPGYSPLADKNPIEDNDGREITQIKALPKLPTKNKQSNMPIDSSTLLRHIQTIYEAINNEEQLRIIYGAYDISDTTGKIVFRPRNAGKPYVLNPYALLWNDGEYYLIATHSSFTNPVHFRVDRIIDVDINTEEGKDGESIPVKRKPIPEMLRPYYKREGKSRIFNSVKYANAHPSMKIYQKDDLVNCTFECTSISLQILIDYFGADIRLAESPISHDPSEVDRNGNPQHFLSATVTGVQRDCAVDFCLSHARYLKLLGPEDLVNDVIERIREIAEGMYTLS